MFLLNEFSHYNDYIMGCTRCILSVWSDWKKKWNDFIHLLRRYIFDALCQFDLLNHVDRNVQSIEGDGIMRISKHALSRITISNSLIKTMNALSEPHVWVKTRLMMHGVQKE